MTTKVEQRGYEDALSWLKEHGFDLIEAPGMQGRVFLRKYNVSAAIQKDGDDGPRSRRGEAEDQPQLPHPGDLIDERSQAGGKKQGNDASDPRLHRRSLPTAGPRRILWRPAISDLI